jgi:tetratricopeptide (TPR) repeat protein
MPVTAANETDQANNAWYWYNKAVDLAYEGKFADAYDANEKALSLNASMPVALANKAGILVQLKRYDEAISVADTLIAANATDLPNTYAAAYYSKGDALRALGRTAEAKEAYDRAYALDNTLVPPDMSRTVPVSTKATRAPVSLIPVLSALGAVAGFFVVGRKNS